MTITRIPTLLVSAAALALAGCGAEEEVVENDVVAMEEPLGEAWDDAYPVAGMMSEQSQTNYDAMDRQAASDEYDANYETMQSEAASAGGSMNSDGAMNANNSAGDTSTSNTSTSNSTMTMPARSEMDFAWLDRNGDGMLSVAEYAIWAVPATPTTPAPNDEKRPFLTQDQINTAGQTFFYFDDDGSTYLSESEFQQARDSAVGSA